MQAVPDTVIDELGAFPRATAKALRDDDPDAVRRVDARAAAVSMRAEVVELRAKGAVWTVDFRVLLERDGVPVTFEQEPNSEGWRIDEETLARTDADRLERAGQLVAIDLEVLVASRRTSVQWHVPTTYTVGLHHQPSPRSFRRHPLTATLGLSGTATLDLKRVGDTQIGPGIWDIVLRAEVLGLELKTRLGVIDESALPAVLPEALLSAPRARAAAFITDPRRALAVEVTRLRLSKT